MSRRKHSATPPEENPALLQEVRAGLAHMGWLMPQEEKQVAAAEGDLAARGTPRCPPALRDPSAVFSGRAAPLSTREAPGLGPSAEARQALARAAREAGRITPEIEQRMRRDRKAAENEMDKGDERSEKD
jgi:hypothetical protein